MTVYINFVAYYMNWKKKKIETHLKCTTANNYIMGYIIIIYYSNRNYVI